MQNIALCSIYYSSKRFGLCRFSEQEWGVVQRAVSACILACIDMSHFIVNISDFTIGFIVDSFVALVSY